MNKVFQVQLQHGQENAPKTTWEMGEKELKVLVDDVDDKQRDLG